jgi:hypothetical protein
MYCEVVESGDAGPIQGTAYQNGKIVTVALSVENAHSAPSCFPDSRNVRPHRDGEWKRLRRSCVRGRLKMASLRIFPIIPMIIYTKFAAIHKAAVPKLARRMKNLKKILL